MAKNIWQKIARDMDNKKVDTQQKKMKKNVFLRKLDEKNIFLGTRCLMAPNVNPIFE
jgi:hypothetical protein